MVFRNALTREEINELWSFKYKHSEFMLIVLKQMGIFTQGRICEVGGDTDAFIKKQEQITREEIDELRNQSVMI